MYKYQATTYCNQGPTTCVEGWTIQKSKCFEKDWSWLWKIEKQVFGYIPTSRKKDCLFSYILIVFLFLITLTMIIIAQKVFEMYNGTFVLLN